METFHQPIREIEATYTLSELVMMSWYSRLQSYNMSKRFEKRPELTSGDDNKVSYIDSKENFNPGGVRDIGNAYQLPEGVNNGVPIPKKFFNEEGELDLRRATGPEAAAYLSKLGIQLMMMPPAI